MVACGGARSHQQVSLYFVADWLMPARRVQMTRERCGVSGAGEKYPVIVYTKKEYITSINILIYLKNYFVTHRIFLAVILQRLLL